MAIPIIIAGVFVIGVLWYLFGRGHKSGAFHHPFPADASRPAEPLVIDQKKRKERLKQRFAPEKLSKQPYDAIIIGSGIGGLTTAAILAKTGRRVLVLEQHGKAGGSCHTFMEQGFEWDVGIHYIGQVGEGSFDRFLIDQLTEGQLQWVKMANDFDNVVFLPEAISQKSAKIIPIVSDRHDLINNLIQMYPSEEAAIREFFKLVSQTRSNFVAISVVKLLPMWVVKVCYALQLHKLIGPVKRAFDNFCHTSVSDVTDRLTDNAELKVIFAYCWGDYFVEPSRAGFGMQAIIWNHYAKGAYYPLGGSSEIAYSLIPVIEKAGGNVLVKSMVKQIIVDEAGKAVGVEVVHGTDSIVTIRAPIVISSAGVPNTFGPLLPKHGHLSPISRLIKDGRVKPSYGCLQAFVGLKGSQSELNLPAKNFWIYNCTDIAANLHKLLATEGLHEAADHAELPFAFLSFASAKDPSYEQRFPGKSCATVITIVPFEWFGEWEKQHHGKRAQDYNRAKERLAQRLWNDFCVPLFPHLADKLEHLEVGTPLSTSHYFNAPQGETLGLDHGLERFDPDVAAALRFKIDEIPGLYLTGQDVLSCGFFGGLYSGLLCAQTIIQNNEGFKSGGLIGGNILGELKKLHKECKSEVHANGNGVAKHNGKCE